MIFEALDTGIMPPVVDKYSQVQDAINEELDKAVIGKQSAGEALTAAQSKVSDILK